MPDSEPRRVGVSFEVKPHAYDPATSPELFEGVLARRVLAFFIDVILIAVPVVFAGLFIFVFGLVTLGLVGFLLWRTKAVNLADVGVVGKPGTHWWRLFTAPFVYENTGYLLCALAAAMLFGWLLERRHGPLVPLVIR